jgi:hypothetical protein
MRLAPPALPIALWFLLGWVLSCGAQEPAAFSTRDFDRLIAPLLAGKCQKCHGAGEPEAGLRLDVRDGAIRKLGSGKQAVVPGDPERSILLTRVTSADVSERMPPSGEPLTAVEIGHLHRWIAAGAPWPQHWAYRPIESAAVPAKLDGAEMRTPIDGFIHEHLRRAQLNPSPEADARTLVRRLYFDLLGLPPLPVDYATYQSDTNPDAYERLVDRLLASPHHGERAARHWMDLVHFAETHGHDQDRFREHAWPYRDYLIRAFNSDLPYGRFVAEQVAGDVLSPNDPWGIVATGLLASGPWDESSLMSIREDTLDREIARYLDRDDILTTVMSTFASSTVHCARCHDHKFDPISQREYYALQAVFAGVDKANRAFDREPATAKRREELTQQLAALPNRKAECDPLLLARPLQQEIMAWEEETRRAATAWTVMKPSEVRAVHGSTLAPQADGSYLASGIRPEKEIYEIILSPEAPIVTAVQLEVLTDGTLPHQGPGRQDNGNLHLNEFVLSVLGSGGAPPRKLDIVSAVAAFNQQGWSIDKALDGNAATAWGIYPEVSKPHRAVFRLKEPYKPVAGERLKIELHQVHGGGHLIGRWRLSLTSGAHPQLEAAVLPGEIEAVLAVRASDRSEAQQFALASHYLKDKYERELASLPAQAMVYCGTNRFQSDGSFRPATAPRKVQLLHRGDVAQPREEVLPGALSCLLELPALFTGIDVTQEGVRRAALARWLTDSRNVLTWRSIANRIWQRHFGVGIVDTPSDFGRLGSIPTHPELLDWLADSLRKDPHGSLKALRRAIVNSATYRQASSHTQPKAERLDADNRLLWRMNRRRLEAEAIRDAALVLAGTLDTRMGGPSVRQFVQTGMNHVTPVVDYLDVPPDDPRNHRRSVYRFIFRTVPDPFHDAMDCPDASQLTPKRNESLTALQALAFLNDRIIVRQGERIAGEIAVHSPKDVGGQSSRLLTLVFGRAPDDNESAQLSAYVERHGLANACRIILNSNEFVFVD